MASLTLGGGAEEVGGGAGQVAGQSGGQRVHDGRVGVRHGQSGRLEARGLLEELRRLGLRGRHAAQQIARVRRALVARLPQQPQKGCLPENPSQ